MKQKSNGKKIFCLLAALTMTMGLFACSTPKTVPSVGGSTKKEAEKSIVVGIANLGAERLDYSIPSGFTNENISRLLYTDYAVRDANGKYDPALGTAKSWESSADSTEWTLVLDQGVLWQDGTEMTSDDVIFGVERMKNPELNKEVSVAEFYGALKSYTAVDKYTVKFVFSRPFPLFLYYIHFVPAMPKAYIEKAGKEAFTKAPIGNGPFKFVSQKLGTNVVFEAFKDYFLGTPSVDKLTLRIIPEASTMIAALKTGEIDVAASVPNSSVSVLQSAPDIKVRSINTGAQGMFVFGERLDPNSPFSDVRVRKAIDLAIDRKGISLALYSGKATPALPFPDSVDAFGMPKGVQPTAYDPERAKALLAEAGYSNGFKKPLRIHAYQSGSTPGLAESAQAVATNLESIGIKTEVVLHEAGQYIPEYIKGSVDGLAMLGVSPNVYDIGTSNFLWAAKGDGLSWMTDADTSELWNKQLSEGNPELRRATIEKAVQTMIDRVSFVNLVQIPTFYAYGSRVADYTKNNTQTVFTDGMFYLKMN
ncbi:ABC transporter substrate-binding protein [Paenibacillus elgii]